MEKHQLAQELRQRQYHLAFVEKRIIDALPDDEIIDSYIICSDCDEKQVTAQELDVAIGLATNAEQFFHLCECIAHIRAIYATARARRPAKRRR